MEQLEADALHLQKVTLNFWKEPDGTYHSRNDVLAYLKGIPGIVLVNGGFANLEFTAQGVSKATGLRFLTDFLGLSMEQIWPSATVRTTRKCSVQSVWASPWAMLTPA